MAGLRGTVLARGADFQERGKLMSDCGSQHGVENAVKEMVSSPEEIIVTHFT